jgi:uncharacterized membrane protein YfcA
MQSIFLIISGCITGFMDSIVGGGGLISLPIMSHLLGYGADAVGTNKIAGASAALMAFLVYKNHAQVQWKKFAGFLLCLGLGSIIGAKCTPYLPVIYFKWLLLGSCPPLLYLILNRNALLALIQQEENHHPNSRYLLLISGLVVGFYDGFFGPGGGTFMLLALLLFARLPLMSALLLSKLANTITAFSSLLTFAVTGHVHWIMGSTMALGMIVGAYVGSNMSSKHGIKLVRPLLVFVILLLMISLITKY